MRGKYLIFLFLVFFISSCVKENNNPDNLEKCPKGICDDGHEYKAYNFVNERCIPIMYFADPCLNHKDDKAECNSDNDCGIGGCSAQLCGKKREVEKVITTCEIKPEYQCLKQSSCSCINNKCQWKQNKEYIECLNKR